MARIPTFDVVVVGAGPAGSTAAFYLAKNKNLRVCIVDRFEFPRHKSCGGLLNHLGDLDQFANYTQIQGHMKSLPINSIRLYWDRTFAFSRAKRPLFRHVIRSEFDHLLLQVALTHVNVTFRRFTVERIVDEGAFLSLRNGTRTIRCKYLVGADGCHSIVSRFLGNEKRSNNDYAFCVEYDIVCKKQRRSTHIFYFYQQQLGYAWLIPTLTGYYLGLGIVGQTQQPTVQYLQEFLAHCSNQGLIPKKHRIAKTFGGHDPVVVADRFASQRVFLCGDALGTVKQATGEGIYYAMLSGRILGETLCQDADNWEVQYAEAIRPVIDSVTSFERIPPRMALIVAFKIISKLLSTPIIPICIRRLGQNWFIERFLQIK